MKKLLFVINSLTIGGSEKSLVSLLGLIDYSEYEVDLLMFKRGEEFDIYIPDEVNVLDEPRYYRYISKKEINISVVDKLKYIKIRINTAINIRINNNRKDRVNTEQILYKSQKKVLDKLEKEYDVAIAYSQGMPTYFIVDKTKAKKKIAWINCDYATTKYDKEFDSKYYKYIDKIVAVSETIRGSILELKPEYKEKIEVILDIVNPNLIEEMSKEGEGLINEGNYVKILTVARLSIFHKGYDLAIDAAKLLKDEGYAFKWYVIGEGPDRGELEKLIKRNKLEDNFVLVGKKTNPYPYMKTCDLYVQPSKKEGFGLTVVEAKILRKPIICCNFNTARELIENGVDGLIVEIDPIKLFKCICEYINDDSLKRKLKDNLKNSTQYSSVSQINKFKKIIN